MTGARHFIDNHVGKTYGSWTVLGFSRSDRNAGFMWSCRCACGAEREISASKLVRGKTFACVSCARVGVQINSLPFKAFYINRVRREAVRRGIEWSVTSGELLGAWERQEGMCALTGIPLNFGRIHLDAQTASLDRIDSSQGYVLGNVQWVHKDVNIMKNKFDQHYFIEMCRLVAAGGCEVI